MNESFIISINIFLAPLVGLLVILIDYYKRRPTDLIQKKLFISLICCSLMVILCDIIHIIIEGQPGHSFRIIHWAANSFFFFFQVLAFSLIVLFFKYTSNGNLAQLKKLSIAVLSVNIVYIVVLVFNPFIGWLFHVTHDNFYAYGEWYIITIIVPYMLMLLCLINVFIHRKSINRALFVLLLVSALPVIIGSTLDLMYANLRIIWHSFFISLLFCYLFIIRMAILIDSLTNVYNRRGCDDYLLTITKPSRRKEYSIIMIDIDKFKMINDCFGHAQGDNALKETAAVLRSSVRRSDFVGRYGGDEFIVIAATVNVEIIIKNILTGIDNFNKKQIRPYTLALSCGGDVYLHDDPRTSLEFLSYVDSLMYREKDRRKQ